MRTRSSKARRTLTCRPGTGTALDIVFKQQLSANGRQVFTEHYQGYIVHMQAKQAVICTDCLLFQEVKLVHVRRCRSVPSRGVFWEAAVRRLSTVLEERHLNNAVLKGFNKAFACVRHMCRCMQRGILQAVNVHARSLHVMRPAARAAADLARPVYRSVWDQR